MLFNMLLVDVYMRWKRFKRKENSWYINKNKNISNVVSKRVFHYLFSSFCIKFWLAIKKRSFFGILKLKQSRMDLGQPRTLQENRIFTKKKSIVYIFYISRMYMGSRTYRLLCPIQISWHCWRYSSNIVIF